MTVFRNHSRRGRSSPRRRAKPRYRLLFAPEVLEGRNLLAQWSGDIAVNTTWTNSEVQQITGNVRVLPGVTLTIQPGTIIKFNTFQQLGLKVDGTLLAPGTAGQPIIFTALTDDSAGGDTNGDGSSSTAYGGQWDAIQFAAGSTGSNFSHVDVRFGGSTSGGQILVSGGGVLSLSNSTLASSSSAGIRITASSPTLTNTTFVSNAIAASMDLASSPAISGVTMTANAVNALRVDGGSLAADSTWNDADITYLLQNAVTVPEGRTLTIAAGQKIKFREFAGFGLTVNGTLKANGTAPAPVIFTSTRDDAAGGDAYNDGVFGGAYSGQWDALVFAGTSTGNLLDHVEVRYGGSTSGGQIVVDAAPLTLTNSRLFDSGRSGIRIQNASPTLTNVTFESNASAASMDLGSNPVISSVTMTANDVNGLLVDGGALPADALWDDPAITYLVNNAITIPAGRTLTIAAGQIIKFREFANFGITVNGTLRANGASNNPVIFTTTRDDAAGGDVYNDGIFGGAYAGQWDALTFGNTSTGSVLDRVEVRYGGSGGAGQIVVDSGQLALTNSRLFDSGSAGIRFQNANPTLTNIVFQDNAIAASMDLAASPTISGVTMTNNDVNALRVDGGTLPADAVWDDPDITYLVHNAITIPAGRSLAIAAGQLIKFREFANLGITVNGSLRAQGTAAAPIIFTTTRDDSVGTNAYNDGAGNTAYAGQWDALILNASSAANSLDHVELRYGGSASGAQVLVNSGPLSLTDSTILGSSTAGVRIVAGNPTLSNVTFQDNAIAASMDLASNPTVLAPTLINNGVNALLVDGGTLASDAHFDDPAIAYLVNNTVTVPVGKTLHVAAGQIIKFREFANLGINVAGKLKAIGDPNAPIIFTTTRDDSIGGNAYNDGPGNTAYAGQWDALTFQATSTASVLDQVELRYGGSQGQGQLRVVAAPLQLANSKVLTSSSAGVRVEGARPTITNVEFQGNAGAAISLNHAGDVDSSGLTASGNGADAIRVDAGTLTASTSWTGQSLPYQLSGNLTVAATGVINIGPNAVFEARDFVHLLGSGAVNNSGSVRKSAGTSTSSIEPTLANAGAIKVTSGTLELKGGLTSTANATINGPVGPTLTIGKNFLGTTTNRAGFEPQTTILFNGAASPASPQLLEAFSRDLGNTGSGFDDNFAFYSLALAANTTVQLVDQSDNAPEAGAEAVYVERLVVPFNATLDLNGLNLYARTTQIAGTVTNGTILSLPDGGALGRDNVTPGRIAVSGEIDDWTIFGRAGDAFTITLSTGVNGVAPPVTPALNFATLTLLDPSGAVVATSTTSASGADVTLSAVTLPADGVYHIQVQAPASQSASTGYYVLAAWNASVTTTPLELGRTVTGNINTPFRADRWTFSANQGQAIRFQLLNAESSAIQFDLTGPSGFTAFTNAAASSELIALPTDGNYTLTVHGSQRQTGAYAFRIEQASIASLSLNTPEQVDIAGGAQSHLFQLAVPQTQQLRISLSDTAAANRNEIFVKRGAIPSRGDYQHRSNPGASANQQVSIPSAGPGTWYVLVYTQAAPQAGSFTIEAAGATLFLTDVMPDFSGNSADMTLTLAGLGFDSSTAVNLVSTTNVVTAASSVRLDQPTQLTATFPAGMAAGEYSVRVTRSGGGTATLPGAFTVKPGGQAKLEANVVVPESMGYHIPATLYVEYSNQGDIAMPAPLLYLRPTQTHADGTTDAKAFLTLDQSLVTAGFWTSAEPAGFSHSIQILASGATPGVLQPGESVRVPVYYAGWQQPWDLSYPAFDYRLVGITADDPSPVDWASMKSQLRPNGIDDSAWNVIFTNLIASTGSTLGDYVQSLGRNAAYLGQLGQQVTDIGRLLGFQVAQAEGMSYFKQLGSTVDAAAPAPGFPVSFSRSFLPGISSRARLGPLGRGWSWDGPWETRLTVEVDGTVAITGADGRRRLFQPDSRKASYFGFLGDQGVLNATGGGTFTIREPDGITRAFRADGRIDFAADPNGNRITAGYTGNLLTSLTHSSGQNLQIAYNAAGRIANVTDPAGRIATYTYDVANEHLLSVTGFDGQKLTYTYSTLADPARLHALLSITHPDGVQQTFGYDSQGRLNDVHLNNNENQVALSFGPGGAVNVTDANGNTTTYYYDDRGLVLRLDDALDRSIFHYYDNKIQLTKSIDAAGQTYGYSYDARGRLTNYTDPLGNTRKFTYENSFNGVASATDAKGNTIRYGYDARGNLTTTTHPDGAVMSMTYDAKGNLATLTDPRGALIEYTYNAAGNVLTKTWPDLSQTVYAYDSRGNMTSAADAAGTTTLTYDTSDRLTGVNYPNGHLLQYEYDAAGRRIRLTDETGLDVRYAYDAAGRISKLTDSTATTIASYTYGPDGRLQRVDNGNNTHTTYEFDAAGQLTHLLNFAPDNSVVSRFDYSYDLVGNPTTMTTLDGVWSYTYDVIGQLTSAAFTSINPASVPNQDLKYRYDAAGNRTQTVINGVTTDYTTNSRNQYLSVGATTYSYDPAGNQISETTGGVTTTFAYDGGSRLVGVSGPNVAESYQYDALGHLAQRTLNGQATTYVVDPKGIGVIVAEYGTGGALSAHYTYGQGLVSRIDSAGASSYYHYDAAGNTASLTSAAGSVVNAYRYEPFGRQLAASGTTPNPFQFSGAFGVLDDAGGRVQMRARSYDENLGRFQSEDPIGTAGGLNLYKYALNSPLARVDPTGLVTPLSPTAWVHVSHLLNLFAEAGYTGFDAGVHGVFQSARQVLGGKVAFDAQKLYDGFRSLARLRGIDITQGAWRVTAAIGQGAAAAAELETTVAITSATAATTTETAIAAGAATSVETGVGAGVAGGAAAEGIGAWGAAAGAGLVIASGIGGVIVGTIINEAILDNDTKELIGDTLVNIADSTGRLVEFIGNGFSHNVASRDPNEKIGPAGFGTSAFVAANTVFPYEIHFENDKDATAPAQRVTIADQLSSLLAWDSFRLTAIQWGDFSIDVPPDLQYYATTVEMTQNGVSFVVQVEAGIHLATGEVYAVFQSLDPETELPPPVTSGFLPPEDGTGRGQGHISYLIRPQPNLASGTPIRNVALITFDVNPAISTDQNDPHNATLGINPAKQALVTIDSGLPTSSVSPLRALENARFQVQWSGADDAAGSGIAAYDVFVSDNGGPATRWQSGVTSMFATFTDGLPGHTYRFFVVATDNVGHAEAAPATFDASTTVSTNPWQNAIDRLDIDDNRFITANDALVIINEINAFGIRSLPATAPAVDFYLDATGDLRLTASDALDVINRINAFGIGPAEGEGHAGEAESMSPPATTAAISVLAPTDPRALDALFSQWAEDDLVTASKRRRKP